LVIGRAKEDSQMRRCWLKGAEGDAVHVIASAVGYKIRCLLR
jgi:transposase, IS5 family